MIMNYKLQHVNMKLNSSNDEKENEVNCSKTAKNDHERKCLKNESMIEVSWVT